VVLQPTMPAPMTTRVALVFMGFSVVGREVVSRWWVKGEGRRGAVGGVVGCSRVGWCSMGCDLLLSMVELSKMSHSGGSQAIAVGRDVASVRSLDMTLPGDLFATCYVLPLLLSLPGPPSAESDRPFVPTPGKSSRRRSGGICGRLASVRSFQCLRRWCLARGRWGGGAGPSFSGVMAVIANEVERSCAHGFCWG
jgi:hypothetical protein